jgi:S1-C subfamily serine protease
MNWTFVSRLALLVLIVAAPETLGASNHADAQSQIWRDASPSEGESELDRLSRAYARLAAAVRPAIVQVRVLGRRQTTADGNPQQDVASRGSGFIIHPQGYVLTAHHVIDRSKTVEVRTATGQRLEAKIIAAEAQIDLALLKVESDQDVVVLPLGDSDNIRVGDLAVVFGYPFGRQSTMNLGIISRAGKSYRDSASYDMIQTDAGAYPGGSGGPLLNSNGHVIGVITMASERGNMGFAVPINVVKRILPRLVNGERLVWGWLGAQMSEISLEQAKTLGLSPVKGVLVRSVLRGQPAERGGVLSQDVILAVNDTQVDSPREVLRMIGGLEAGRVVKLTILRAGRTLQLAVPLGTKPEPTQGHESNLSH